MNKMRYVDIDTFHNSVVSAYATNELTTDRGGKQRFLHRYLTSSGSRPISLHHVLCLIINNLLLALGSELQLKKMSIISIKGQNQ